MKRRRSPLQKRYTETLTIMLSASQRDAVTEYGTMLGKSRADIVREAIDEKLAREFSKDDKGKITIMR